MTYKGIEVEDYGPNTGSCDVRRCFFALSSKEEEAQLVDVGGGYRFCPGHAALATKGETVGYGDMTGAMGLDAPRSAMRAVVYSALDSERAYQDAKGVEASGVPHQHELEAFALYMDDYMAEFKNQLSRIWTSDGRAPTEALHTLRKITALGVAAMEQHGALVREGF
jgi:hypothetical protein